MAKRIPYSQYSNEEEDDGIIVEPQRTPLPKPRTIVNEDDDERTPVLDKGKKRKLSVKGQSYSIEETKSMLYSVWKEFSPHDAYKQFIGEFPDTSRTKTSFNQKYVSLQREIHEKTHLVKTKAVGGQDLLANSPTLAYEFLKPSFVSTSNKYYFVVNKAHYASVSAGYNSMYSLNCLTITR